MSYVTIRQNDDSTYSAHAYGVLRPVVGEGVTQHEALLAVGKMLHDQIYPERAESHFTDTRGEQ